MGSRLSDESILARLEHSWLEPPYMKSNLPLCTCCGGEINEPYLLDGKRYCSDCATEMCRAWQADGEGLECEGCGEIIPDDEPYFDVGDDEHYCEKCFRKFFRE